MAYFMGTGYGEDLGYKAGTNLPGTSRTGDGVTGGSGTEMNDIWNLLLNEGYSSDEIEQILQLAELEGQTDILKEQQEYANKLREGELVNTEGINSGRVYTAASPFSHMASIGHRLKGKRETDRIEEERNRILQEQTAARLKWLRKENTPNVVGDKTADQTMDPIRAGKGVLW
jgi:hypothetical protein